MGKKVNIRVHFWYVRSINGEHGMRHTKWMERKWPPIESFE
jgi:hypothetical protein